MDEAPQSSATQLPVINLPATEMYIAAATVGIIVAIAVATLLIIRKR